MSIKSKALFIITPGFPSDEGDSTCLPSIQTFVRALNRNFPALSVVIISLQYPYRKETYRWNDNVVIALNGKNMPTVLRPCLWLRAYSQLRRLIQRYEETSILSLWCMEAALIGKFFAKRNHLQHYTWILGQDARKANAYVRWIKPESKELIALSESLVAEFEKNHGARPGHIVPNSIDEESFVNTTAPRTIDIFGAGSLIPLKQYGLFVRVVKELVTVHPKLTVVLAGTGSEEAQLKQLIENWQLQDTITLTGEIPHGDVLEMMQKSKVFLHPSSYEGYSTVCLEALYAGCHVVSFVKGENREIDHWHVARDLKELVYLTSEILTNRTDFSRVVVNSSDCCARAMMALYGVEDTTE